jgi:hypothetical protein
MKVTCLLIAYLPISFGDERHVSHVTNNFFMGLKFIEPGVNFALLLLLIKNITDQISIVR